MSESSIRQVAGRHIPELDGLRGLAILLVMFGHLTVVDPGGWLERFANEVGATGVDLFFVLSGFLITGVLLDAKGKEGYLKNFYIRRVLRIVPLYYCLLFIFTILFPLILPRSEMFPNPWVTDPIWYWTFLSNFLVFSLGEFPQEVMTISWSLAIEEQFYIFWPFFVILFKPKTLKEVCVGLIFAGFVVRTFLVMHECTEPQIYVFTFGRLDGLLVGAIIAIIVRSDISASRFFKYTYVALGVGILGIILSNAIEFIGEATGDRTIVKFVYGGIIFYGFLALLFGSLLALTLYEKDNWYRRIFRNRVLKKFGLYSYAIYLTHNTIGHSFEYLGIGVDDLGGGLLGQLVFYVAAGGLSFGFAYLSYTFLEKRFLSINKRMNPKHI